MNGGETTLSALPISWRSAGWHSFHARANSQRSYYRNLSAERKARRYEFEENHWREKHGYRYGEVSICYVSPVKREFRGCRAQRIRDRPSSNHGTKRRIPPRSSAEIRNYFCKVNSDAPPFSTNVKATRFSLSDYLASPS